MNDLISLREKVKHLSILIVDDEEDILEGSVTFMKKFFKDIHSASSADLALEMFIQNGSFDIVLTDIQMPGMTGWELVEKLRKRDKKLFIAAMTGSPEVDNQQILLCDIYLKKPLDIDDMSEMLDKIVNKYAL